MIRRRKYGGINVESANLFNKCTPRRQAEIGLEIDALTVDSYFRLAPILLSSTEG